MHLLYVDESGDNGLPKKAGDPFNNSEFFIRVGVAFHDKQWHQINDRIQKFRDSITLPQNIEIHATEVLSGKLQKTVKQKGKKKKIKTKNWFGNNYPQQSDRKRLLEDFLEQAFNGTEISVLVVVIDKKKINLNVSPKHVARNPKLKSLEMLTERYNLYIKCAHDKNGLIIMDSVGPMDDSLHHGFQNALYSDSPNIQRYHFIESLLFAPSEHSNLLQLADVCAYAVKRALCDSDNVLYNKIEKFLFSNCGKVEGRGFKRWPK